MKRLCTFLSPIRSAGKNLKRFQSIWPLLIGISLLAASRLSAQLINVDFNLNSSASSGNGPAQGPTMSGGAVLGTNGDQWNGINVASGNAIPLKDSLGNTTLVTMTFTSPGGYDARDYSGTTPFANTSDDGLMEDYLYNSGSPQTISLAGLSAKSIYNLVVYNAADANGAGRTTYFTVNGVTMSSTWNGTSNTLVPGVDYVDFPSALSDESGSLVITWTGSGTTEGDLDGFQIQRSEFVVSAVRNNTNTALSFMTQSGISYQVQYKNQLMDLNWNPIGSVVAGNNSIQSINDPAYANTRFYRIERLTNTLAGLTPLQTRGTNLINPAGAVVQLKGVNLGSWLVMEKWMCPMDSGSLPDNYSIITNLDNRFGVPTEQSLIRAYQTNWITTADLNNITHAGFNCVRVPVWWGDFYSITNTTSSGWRTDAFSQLDWMVTNCAARNLYVIIDLHGVIGSQSTNQDTGQQELNAYWTNTTDQAETAWMWSQIASHYNGNATVAGYDLMNEPYSAPGTAAVWAAYNSLYNAIRVVDKNHVIIMEGTFGSWNWSMLPNPASYGWTNIVYSMHEYQYGGSVAQIEAGSDNQVSDFVNHRSWNVPGHIGEWNDMGQGAGCYDYSINDYNQAGISWTMWAYKATHGLVPDGWGWYDPTYWPATPNLSTDSAATILSDWQQWRTSVSFGVNTSVGL